MPQSEFFWQEDKRDQRVPGADDRNRSGRRPFGERGGSAQLRGQTCF